VRSEVHIPFQTAITGGTVDLQLHRPDGRVETIAVKIPAGIETGKSIRLRGQGEPSPDGDAPGDLLIKVHFSEHPHFHRRGKNLYVKLPVTLAEAAVGAKVDVPTPRGTVSIRVPPSTSTGTRLRVKGRGIETSGEPAGDLFAEIQIILPKTLSDEERAWFESFGERHPDEPRKDLKW
jgi:DnaJ-class molecular chaperone